MKRQIIQGFCAMLLLASCNHSSQSTTEVAVVDIAAGMNQLTELKTSDLGTSIRYVSLETTDSCLIGNKPLIQVLKDKILITTQQQNLLFDKQSGKFLCSVGHLGEDPEGHSGTSCWINEETGILYFFRRPDELVKYNQEGKYIGKVKIPVTSTAPNYFAFADSVIVGHYTDFLGSSARSLVFFDERGTLHDTLPALVPSLLGKVDDVASISVIKNDQVFGNMTLTGIIMAKFKNGIQHIAPLGVPVLWKSDGRMRFRETYVDTLYTVENNRLHPYFVFDTGKWHWPATERVSTSNSKDRVVLTYVAEGKDKLFFQCVEDLYGENKGYNGVYDKSSGTTQMALMRNGFEDDLNHFLPMHPMTCGEQGEFVALIQPADALEWLEEHPEAKANNKLTFLKHLNEEMNPIVVLLE